MWFPAVRVPLVVDAVRDRTVELLTDSGRPGAVARTAEEALLVLAKRELSFKLQKWHANKTGQCPIPHARAKVDWLTLDALCATAMFPVLKNGNSPGHSELLWLGVQLLSSMSLQLVWKKKTQHQCKFTS